MSGTTNFPTNNPTNGGQKPDILEKVLAIRRLRDVLSVRTCDWAFPSFCRYKSYEAFLASRQQEIEDYALGRLGPPGHPVVVRLEEHLMNCSYCLNVAEHAVELAQVIRLALTVESSVDD
jgi:hypothetical protein